MSFSIDSCNISYTLTHKSRIPKSIAIYMTFGGKHREFNDRKYKIKRKMPSFYIQFIAQFGTHQVCTHQDIIMRGRESMSRNVNMCHEKIPNLNLNST